MKAFLALTIVLASTSSFALSQSRAIALAKASRGNQIKVDEVKRIGATKIQVNYSMLDGRVCSSTVSEKIDAEKLATYTVKDGYCFQ